MQSAANQFSGNRDTDAGLYADAIAILGGDGLPRLASADAPSREMCAAMGQQQYVAGFQAHACAAWTIDQAFATYDNVKVRPARLPAIMGRLPITPEAA
jgi:hypothetical protein